MKVPQNFEFPPMPDTKSKPLSRDELLFHLIDLYWAISQLYHELKLILEPEIDRRNKKIFGTTTPTRQDIKIIRNNKK